MLVRKADIHDDEGMKLLLQHGANPNLMPRFRTNALQHAILRDNHLPAIEMLLAHGADPSLTNNRDGKSAIAMAAHRGRGDLLKLFEDRGISLKLDGVDRLVAACAMDDREAIRELTVAEPQLVDEMVAQGGMLLSEFAGNGNLAGVRNLLDSGIDVAAIYPEGDNYFDVAKGGTALHNAAWRARHEVVKGLIDRGAPVNVSDAKGRTPLMLAVKACIDSYWRSYRTPESVEALLRAGASVSEIQIPCGYDEVDTLLRQHPG
jgi:ankyrin repeat protein